MSDVQSFFKTLIQATGGLLNYQWLKLWPYQASKAWSTTGGAAVNVEPSTFYGYGAAALAFMLSFIGAVDNLSQTVVSVEAGIDNWLAGYADGKYINVVKEVETSEAMQAFLLTFTFDMIAYVLTSVLHSCVILWVGYASAYWIMDKMTKWEELYKNDTPSDVPISKGYTALLFGVLMGTVGYLAGTVTQGIAGSVMLSLGFTDHSYTDQSFQRITSNVALPIGAPAATTAWQLQSVDVAYDYEKLLKMEDKWWQFFALQRALALLSPYVFIYCVDAALGGAALLMFLYIGDNTK